ncbi:restriction endonuclease subunit S [Stutzerimonas xanthomarina]|uniref:restriction endonuclease subunit S n=1 Tax=Stutzerimonas xanthomarina TaxID=271420 RepID=UPI003AA8A200
MSHYKPYPVYKDSRVEWLGAIPGSWEISRLGFEAWVRARLGWKGLKAEEYVDEGYAFLSTPDIKGKEINFSDVNFITEERYKESPEIKLAVGDVLLAKDGSTLGTVNVVRKLPRAATVNGSIAVITPCQRLSPLYLYYLFKGSYLENTIQVLKGGMGVPHLFQWDINKFKIPLPGMVEQAEIAAHLDRETARIDALIEKKTRFIELLREKRQALTTHAATKGLDPNVMMKDSGVEWLGEVPEHWIICNVQHVIAKIEQGWSPDCLNTPAEDGQWGVVKSGCVNGGTFTPEENKALPVHLSPMPEYEIKVGDVLMSRASGSPELIGSIALVKETPEKLILSDKLFRLQCSEKMLPSFFTMVMGARVVRAQVEQSISGADGLANNLPQSRIKKFVLPCPPVKEQLEIASFTDAQICRLQGLREKTERSIELLKERRSALITAAVTGQIDLREAV